MNCNSVSVIDHAFVDRVGSDDESKTKFLFA